MIGNKNDQIAYRLMIVAVLVLTGCDKSGHQTPPKQEVQDSVANALPPFLSLDSIEVEPIGAGSETVKMNFKAIVFPKEDMYVVDREVDGTPKVTLLKTVQNKGAQFSLYGFVLARRMVDKWTLEMPVIQTGLSQFGTPRGSFGPQSFIAGSSDAIAALQQQEANAELQRQAKKAALEREERERIERAEQQTKEQQALREIQEKNRIAMDAAEREAAAQRKIEADKRKLEEQKQAALAHVEKMEELATEAARDLQSWIASGNAWNTAQLNERRAKAADAKKVAIEARKEYEAVWGSSKP